MHSLPAPRINKNSPAVMAARLYGYLDGVRAIGERLIEPAPTQRDIREAEREGHAEHVKHLKLRFAEGCPRIVALQSVELLTHIRRVEYQLRCFILWLAAILIEKAQKNPDFHRSLFRDSRASAKAQAVEPEARSKAEQYGDEHAGISRDMPDPDPRLRGDERVDTNPNNISDFIWSQELEMRRLSAQTYPIGGFSVTTPVIDSKRRNRRSRIRHLTPDSSRMVDASYLMARLARLPRILARADQMAERLAKRALASRHEINRFDPHLDPPLFKGRTRFLHLPGNTLGVALPLEKAGLGGSEIGNDFPTKEGDRIGRYLPAVSVSMARTPPPNPLYFEPLSRVVPPDKLWDSTEDDEESGDMTWLHFIASDTLQRIGFAPGPDAGSCLPDLSRYEPPAPPQVRSTI